MLMLTWVTPSNEDSIRFNPFQSDAIRFNPIQSDSIRFKLIQSDSIPFNPIQSDSIRLNPIKSDSIRLNRIQSDSIRFNPIQSDNPIHSDSIRFNPIQSYSIRFNPIQTDSNLSNSTPTRPPMLEPYDNKTASQGFELGRLRYDAARTSLKYAGGWTRVVYGSFFFRSDPTRRNVDLTRPDLWLPTKVWPDPTRPAARPFPNIYSLQFLLIS